MTAEASKWNYRALDTQTLEYLSESLAAGPKVSQFRFPEGARDAAVLLPLCLPSPAEGSSESILPSVLFTLRSSNLNSHQGEVSFPGGKRDPGDVHLSDTVLRETLEETSLAPNSVRLLGPMSAVPAKNPMLRIHPFVGFPQQPPLPTLDISQLMFNPSEVDRIFTRRNVALADPTVRDIVARSQKRGSPVIVTRDGHTIWGLTAFVLHRFLTLVS
ncbi:hypothetical protein GQ42DRAFT_116469 [Ramicandelaber brevisporus]|nr:hypothetical protein GQ42DRAFT_116469 [Ramicandelaber brevisporus]